MATFKASARALDMLGRQQIAGRPTAISELFKNAHDAYADRVEVDYFRSNGLFILRDDGIGMTYNEFIERWLTLGTNSKLGSKMGIDPPFVTEGKKLRPVLGEKGIGRLAIAAIGPQVLILTRAIRKEIHHDLVACYIHWGLFVIPGIKLEDVRIPMREFEGGTLPTANEIDSMVKEVNENLTELRNHIPDQMLSKIRDEISQFIIDPCEIENWFDKPSLTGNEGIGTHFFIKPADKALEADLEIRTTQTRDDEESNLKRFLLGFSNTLTPSPNSIKMKTSFRYHKTDDDYSEQIGDNEFWTEEEFKKADHYIKGRFDEYGQFRGFVTIYGMEPDKHIVPWRKAQGRRTECGPFDINLAIVQGAFKGSSDKCVHFIYNS